MVAIALCCVDASCMDLVHHLERQGHKVLRILSDDKSVRVDVPVVPVNNPRRFEGIEELVAVHGVDWNLLLSALRESVPVLCMRPLTFLDASRLMVLFRTAELTNTRLSVPSLVCSDTPLLARWGHPPTHYLPKGDVETIAMMFAEFGTPTEIIRPCDDITIALLEPWQDTTSSNQQPAPTWVVVHEHPIPTSRHDANKICACLERRQAMLGETTLVNTRACLEVLLSISSTPFRAAVPRFRMYKQGITPDRVVRLYRDQREWQSHKSAMQLALKYGSGGCLRLTMWEALQLLRTIVDKSDPDMLSLPNDAHALQTAAMLERDGHPRHMVALGLVHDLGKIMATVGMDEDGTSRDEQWAVVGDTFVTGHPIPQCVPFPEFNPLNEDDGKPSEYVDGCGLENVVCTWGHDEWLYRALVRNSDKHTLPEECLYIARFHSLYPWHSGGAYTNLESIKDIHMKPYVRLFQAYDLYSKDDQVTESWEDPKWRELVEDVFGTDKWNF